MIYFLFVILTIVGCILGYNFEKHNLDCFSCLSWVIGALSGIIVVVMTIILAVSWASIPATEAKWHERYEALNCQIDNHLYSVRDRNNLIERVNSWNEDFVVHEVNKDNIWVAIFNPCDLEGLSKIDLERIN